MARIFKEVTVKDKTISVFELTVKDVKKLWQDITGATPETAGKPFFSNEKIMRDYWDKCVHGIKLEDADDMTPSELKIVYDAFLEVNAIFFDLALQLEGENPLLKGLRITLLDDLMLRFAALSFEATPESGTTATPSSSKPQKKT